MHMRTRIVCLDILIPALYAPCITQSGERGLMWIAVSLIASGGFAVAAASFIVIGHRKLDDVLASFGFRFAHD